MWFNESASDKSFIRLILKRDQVVFAFEGATNKIAFSACVCVY